MCDYSGYPSANGELRLFSEEECQSKGGLWHANGECSKAGGGSYSYDCRGMNTDPGAIAHAASKKAVQATQEAVSTATNWLSEYRWYVAGAGVVGGVLWWKLSKRRTTGKKFF
jgi:hypothetical protein